MIRIHIPKFKSGGELRLVTYEPVQHIDSPLIIADDTGWFDNLVLDGGLINMTTASSWADRFHIGSSSVPPSITQTALIDWLAQSNSGVADIGINLGGLDYQAQTTRTRRFEPDVSRIIREIGVNAVSSNTNMSIRALVTPEISQSDEQILDASYRYTAWPAITTAIGTTNIFGDDYDTTVRLGNVDAFTKSFANYRPGLSPSSHFVTNGDVGSITGIPAGDSETSTSVLITSQGSGFCTYTVTFGVDEGNLTPGIRSLASLIVDSAPSGVYIQVQFDRDPGGETIPKDNTREISFDLAITWDRH